MFYKLISEGYIFLLYSSLDYSEDKKVIGCIDYKLAVY
jgi:hypothetical protein